MIKKWWPLLIVFLITGVMLTARAEAQSIDVVAWHEVSVTAAPNGVSGVIATIVEAQDLDPQDGAFTFVHDNPGITIEQVTRRVVWEYKISYTEFPLLPGDDVTLFRFTGPVSELSAIRVDDNTGETFIEF